jgi:hypothetical protein
MHDTLSLLQDQPRHALTLWLTLKNLELLTINSRHEVQFLFDGWYSTICIFTVQRGKSTSAADAHLLCVVIRRVFVLTHGIIIDCSSIPARDLLIVK